MSESTDILQATVREFIHQTAAKTPTPGGGSVAGVVGALAAALGEMSLNFSIGKKAFADHAETHQALLQKLETYRTKFLDLVDDDIKAFTLYQEAAAMEAGDEKTQAEQDALLAASLVPRDMACLALNLQYDLKTLAGCCSKWLISDLVAAAALAVSVATLSDFNVRINAKNLTDSTMRKGILRASRSNRQEAEQLAAEIETACANKLDG